jgi:hypothetical protein
MEKVIHKTKGLCVIWSEFTDYFVLVDSNGKKFQAQAHDFTRAIDTTATEVTELPPYLSFLESTFKADVKRSPIDINDLSIITDDVVKALGIDEEVARVIVTKRPDKGYTDFPHLTTILSINNVSLDHRTIEHFKSMSLVIFGGVEEMY